MRSELHEADGEAVRLHDKVEEAKLPSRGGRGRTDWSAPDRNVVEGPRSVDPLQGVVHLKGELVDPGQQIALGRLGHRREKAIDAHCRNVPGSAVRSTKPIFP